MDNEEVRNGGLHSSWEKNLKYRKAWFCSGIAKNQDNFLKKLCTGHLGVHQRAVWDAEFTLLRHKQVKRGLRLTC